MLLVLGYLFSEYEPIKNSPTYTTRHIHVTMYRYRASTCSIKAFVWITTIVLYIQGHQNFSHWLVRYLVRVQANYTPCGEATITCNNYVYIPLNLVHMYMYTTYECPINRNTYYKSPYPFKIPTLNTSTH